MQAVRVQGTPVGLVAALGLSLSVVAGAGAASGSRAGALAAAAGWLAGVVALATPRAEGDLVLPATWTAYGWLFGGTLLGGLAAAWPYRGGGRGRSRPPTPAPVPAAPAR